MPRVKRRTKRRKTGYTEAQVDHLLTGHDMFGDGFGTDGPSGECNVDAMHAAWLDLRDKLLRQWIAEQPGTRPYAWWRFDAPEPRRRIDGKPHPFENPERRARVKRWKQEGFTWTAHRAYLLYFGIPTSLIVRDDFEAEYETVREYLKRRSWLSDSEREELEHECNPLG